MHQQHTAGVLRGNCDAVARSGLAPRYLRLVAGALLPLSALGALAVASPSAGATTPCGSSGVPSTGACTYSYTGSADTFTVPPGVTQVTIDAAGAQGGTGNSNVPGGTGAQLEATFGVAPGEVLHVVVGGQGMTNWRFGIERGPDWHG